MSTCNQSSLVSTPARSDDVRFCPVLSGVEISSGQNKSSDASNETYTPKPTGHDRTSPSSAVPDHPQEDLPPAANHAFVEPCQQPAPASSSESPVQSEDPRAFNIYHLTPMQHRAIDLLLAGYPCVQVAETLGISTRTIQRWKNAQPEFIAQYNRRVAEHSTVTAGRLRHLVDLAVAELETLFRGDNLRLRTSASLRMLSTLVSRQLAHHYGPLTHQEVLAEFVKQQLRAHNEDDKTPLTTSMCDDYLAELTVFLGTEAAKDLAHIQPPAK